MSASSLGIDGFWSDLSHPRAAYYNGKTYLIWINDAGDVKVGAYAHSTQTMGSAFTLHSAFVPPDGTIHTTASIIVRSSDRRLVAVYSGQGSRPFYRISTNAEDTSAWGAETAFMANLPTVTTVTYGFLAELASGNLVFLTRFFSTTSSIFKWSYAYSSDGGTTWDPQADILIPSTTNASYLFAAATGNKLHILATNTNRIDSPSSVYHMYLDAGVLYKSDGTSIAGPYPVEATAGTLVQDASGGSARCNGIAFESNGNPAGVLLIDDADGHLTNTIKVARWTGSAWQVNTVTNQNGQVDSNNFVASAQIVKNDPDIVYVPVKTGSVFELYRYSSINSGVTWAGSQLTSGSASDNAMPETPLDAAPGLAVIWGRGTYTSASNFDFTLYGLSSTSPGVWVDWDNDGFAEAGASATGLLARMMPEGGVTAYSDNITEYVMSIAWQRGAQGDFVGGSGQDSATIIVQNTSGRFNPDNTASPLYGRLRPGRRVWMGVNADGTLSGSGQTIYGLFAGKVREIVPIPEPGAADAPTVEILCDGILQAYSREAVRLADSTTRSQGGYRSAVLAAIGETRTSLPNEIDTLPLSSADSNDALSVLENLNRANGSRHYIAPGDTKEDWYAYTAQNRHYKLGSAADYTLSASSQHVTSFDGYRVTADGIINVQRATVDPVNFPFADEQVWEYGNLPFALTGNMTIWANFEDYVGEPALGISSTGATVTSSITPFGHSAKIELSSTGATVTALTVRGLPVTRGQGVTVTSDNLPEAAPSQSAYGVRAGGDLSGDLLGARASAQGIVDHIVWRFAGPLARPAVTVENWQPQMYGVEVGDVIALTVAQLDISAKKFDVIGIRGFCRTAASATVNHWTITYQLSESRIQDTSSPFFLLNTDALNSTSDLLGY